VPLELSLAPDLDRGGHRYRAALSGVVDVASLRELSDWIASAAQNPDARFQIDLSSAAVLGRRARVELRALLRRHGSLRRRGRLAVVGAKRQSHVRVQPRMWPATV
jgi:hypothetical protein